MTRNGAAGRNAGKGSERRQPAAQAAVNHRNVLQKDEIAGKQRLRSLVQDGEVVIRMGDPPRMKRQHAVAEIEPLVIDDLPLRGNKLNIVQHISHDAPECIEVERPAFRKRARQMAMTHEYRSLLNEGRIAERVIRMRVGIDHVADRLCRNGADRSA